MVDDFFSQQVGCPYCGYKWQYKGRDKHYACCPKCKSKVRIHPYVRRGYAELKRKKTELYGFKPLKYPNENYEYVGDLLW